MFAPEVNAVVRLTHDVPTLYLTAGDVGVVQSVWLSPTDCYEVEFDGRGQAPVRALLRADLFDVIGAASTKKSRGNEGVRYDRATESS